MIREIPELQLERRTYSAAVAVAALVAVFVVIDIFHFDSPVKSQVSSEGFGRHLPLSVISSSNKAC